MILFFLRDFIQGGGLRGEDPPPCSLSLLQAAHDGRCRPYGGGFSGGKDIAQEYTTVQPRDTRGVCARGIYPPCRSLRHPSTAWPCYRARVLMVRAGAPWDHPTAQVPENDRGVW